ncbi:hypothetical protein LX32DRAFT_323241 [Colletotrichum zoysiae]|uniref:Uncharacterized protein n=1 Tax=Colletotrichum zoysiae TaxID=1216348 RepID=A0AAD9H161_9PEZI|nr:hypothetical protein LX32DRAFT_323241 [Colletotrichum zoysiae]
MGRLFVSNSIIIKGQEDHTGMEIDCYYYCPPPERGGSKATRIQQKKPKPKKQRPSNDQDGQEVLQFIQRSSLLKSREPHAIISPISFRMRRTPEKIKIRIKICIKKEVSGGIQRPRRNLAYTHPAAQILPGKRADASFCPSRVGYTVARLPLVDARLESRNKLWQSTGTFLG